MGRKFGVVAQMRQVGGKKGYSAANLSEDFFPDVAGRGMGVGEGLGEWV